MPCSHPPTLFFPSTLSPFFSSSPGIQQQLGLEDSKRNRRKRSPRSRWASRLELVLRGDGSHETRQRRH
ncbi:Endoribonuclease YSH1 [Fusarium oxysporum f. sp. albedinis]|nr:Endoribonuclease YSH1 [Fusarium oxysporum f. sp. albedinis]